MRLSDFDSRHAERTYRGSVNPRRAAPMLPRISDGTNEVANASELLFTGGTVTEPEDGVAQITLGGTTGGGGGNTSSATAITMLNNSSQDLLLGDVVVVDETADRAVTVTTSAGDIRIVGIVQEPIPAGGTGLVLFNGYAAVVNASGVARGEYAQTSTTAALATSTSDREAGSFAVYLTGDDFSEFVSDSRTTTSDIPVETLTATLPPSIPDNRILFLALWLTDGVSSVDVDGWTLIGSETGFYYYTRVSTGADAAVATWTTASVAVMSVLLLHATISLAAPVESHDYDATTSAASVSGLSDAARYAIAGVQSDATPGSGFTLLAGGSAGFDSGSSLSIVQETSGVSGSCTFGSAVTPGNLLISAMAGRDDDGVVMALDASGVADSSWTDVATNANTATPGASDYVSLQAKIASSSSAGPFYNTDSGVGAASNLMYMFEVAGVGVDGYEAFQSDGEQSMPANIGTFATVGTDDLVIMAAVLKDVSAGYPGVSPGGTGFTQDELDRVSGGHPVFWVGHRSGSGGSVDAEFSHTGSNIDWYVGLVAAHFVSGSQAVDGTLAGKYIGHDASVTSPFTGTDQDDAIFAFNLLQDAKASALLYGPDLGTGGGSEPTADAHIADTTDAHDASAISLLDSGGLFTATDVEAAIAELATKDIGYSAHSNMGATETFSALTGWHSGTFDADCTFTFSDATSGIVASMVLELTEDGTGGWQPTWPGSVVWPGGSAPTHDDTAGTTTLYLFQSRDGGTTWYGFQAGSGGGSSVAALDDLSDVTITTPAEDDQLQYISGQWVNNARRWEPVTFDPGTGPEIVFDSTDVVMTWKAY